MNRQEKEKAKEFITEYQSINSKIEVMESKLKELFKEKTNLLESANKVKEREANFINQLKEKYGADKITPLEILKQTLC
mgnify:CR=1 FL=1